MRAGTSQRRGSRRCSGRGQRGQTLILIFLGAVLFGAAGAGAGGMFGGASLPVLRTHVREAMADQDLRAQVDRTLDRVVASAKRYDEDRKRFEADVFAQLARHDATPADLRPLVVRGDELHQRIRGEFLDLRFELRGQLTRAQWHAVFAGAAASAPVPASAP